MTIKNNQLLLHKRLEKKSFPDLSLDVFLRSFAEEKGNTSVDVILSAII
jgi:hypothetical protein